MDQAQLALLSTQRAGTFVSTSALPGAPIVEVGPGRFRTMVDRFVAPTRSRRIRTAAEREAASASEDRPARPDPVRAARRPPVHAAS
jgi:hypothetical protein